MSAQGAGFLSSCIALALYTGMRLGSFAPGSTAALREAMGPPSRFEKLGLLFGTAILFLGFLWMVTR